MAIPKVTAEISSEIPSASAGGLYLIAYISNIIPSGSTFIGMLKVNAGGYSSLDAGSLIALNNDLYYAPTTTQTPLTIKYRVFYTI